MIILTVCSSIERGVTWGGDTALSIFVKYTVFLFTDVQTPLGTSSPNPRKRSGKIYAGQTLWREAAVHRRE